MKPFSLCSFAACLVIMVGPVARAQSIANPGFEVNGFLNWPGYASGNGGAIAGWTFTGDTGLNPAAGQSPFADNGAVPQGSSVAFLQSGGNAGTLSTTITGLTPGFVYRVRFRANCRSNYAEPVASWSVNGGPWVYFTCWPAAGLNGYYNVTRTFTATASSAGLAIKNEAAVDTALLVDDFSVAVEATSGWAASYWIGNASSGLSPQTHWARRFGSAAGTTINGAAVTGVDGSNPAEPGKFSTTGFPNVNQQDVNNLTAGADSATSGELARNFVWGGSPATLTLEGLEPGKTYVVSLFSVGWDPLEHRPIAFSSGGQEFVVDQNLFGENTGLRVDYTFVADADTRVLTFTPLVAGYTFHLYGIALQQPLLVTSSADTGNGSLRAAIATAAALPGPDFIAFSPPLSGQTIPLGSTIPVNDPASVVIDASTLAAGLTLDRSGGYQHFVVDAACALRGLTMINGRLPNPNAGSGGAISNHGALELLRCTFSNNASGAGGAIVADGWLSATDCTFSGNSATDEGGAILITNSDLTLTRCTFSGNTAFLGGAIYQHYGVCVVTHCTFAGNSATNVTDGIAGAILCGGINGPGSRANFTHCTFSGNSAGAQGGAIFCANTTGSVTVTDCIVAGNTAPVGADIVFRGNFVRAGANVILSMANTGSGSESGPAAIMFPPLLAPLANYGGLTATMALRPGSPARNVAGGPAPIRDQRGFPMAGAADIGAYEAGTLTNCAASLAETFSPNAPAASVGPAGDFDGDGSTNEQECNALTNPSSAASFFRILTTVRTPGDIVITFPTVFGRHYTLWRADTPAGTWTDTGLLPVTGDGTNRTFTAAAPIAGTPRRFYRVQARP